MTKILSVILPVYNESAGIQVLHDRLSSAAERLNGVACEFVFVNDGSADTTEAELLALRQQDPRVQVISLARNSGSHTAIFAGLDRCTGTAAVVMAADLQDPPELLERLVEKWQGGCRTVWAVRDERKGESAWTLWTSKLYYACMNRVLPFRIPPQGADVFLIDRSVVDLVRQSPEKNTSVFLLVAWFGVGEGQIGYIKEARAKGRSKWTFRKRVKLFCDSVFSFSPAPLRLLGWLGGALTTLGLLQTIWAVLLVIGRSSSTWAITVLAVVLLLSGIQLLSLSLVGEYVWRIFENARPRPRYVLAASTLPLQENRPQ